MTVPVTAACSSVSQLYAQGKVYDPILNEIVATTTSTMNPGQSYYNGQLEFNLPPSVVEHPLQITVAFFTNNTYGYYTGQVASIYFTATIHSGYGNYGNYGNYPNYGYYPYYPSYPNTPYGCPNNNSGYMYYYNGNYYYEDCHYDRH